MATIGGRVAALDGSRSARDVLGTIGSLAASIPLTALIDNWHIAFIVSMALLAHETGHYVVARIGGTAVTGPVILAPLGAVVLSRQPDNARAHRAIAVMLAAGPTAGALAATLGFAAWRITGDLDVLGFARISVFLNLINLLPIGMLDGGRLARLAGIPAWAGLLLSPLLMLWGAWLLVPVGLSAFAACIDAPSNVNADRRITRRVAAFGWMVPALWLTTLALVTHTPV